MRTPSSAGRTSRGQLLAAQAAEAAEVRDALTHPDVVALRVERIRVLGERLIWASIAILLVFTVITVQVFVARDAAVGSLEWFGAWFLEPGMVLGLVGLLIWEGTTSRWRVPTGPWVRSAKWGLLAGTYLMNTWRAWGAGPDWAGVLAHSVPPLAVFFLTEARTEMLDKLEECVLRAHTAATTRAERKAKTPPGPQPGETPEPPTGTSPGQAPAALTPIPAPAAPAFRVVPNLAPPVSSTPTNAPAPNRTPARHDDEPARDVTPHGTARNGTARADSARTPRSTGSSGAAVSDADLIDLIRGMTQRNGGTPPTPYQLRQEHGVGRPRAQRLLAELDTTPPVGQHGTTPKGQQHDNHMG